MGVGRAIIVDDHVGVTESLAIFLRQRRVCDVLASASTIREGKSLCREHSPDLLILDLLLEDGDGLDLLRFVRRDAPKIKVLVYSGCCKEAILMRAMDLCPDGFVSKNSNLKTLTEAVTAILQEGRNFICPSMSEFTRRVYNRMRQLEQSLSERDRAILSMIVAGLPSKAIAGELAISQRNVDSCRSRIMSRMGTYDLPSLVRTAVSLGLVAEDRVSGPRDPATEFR